MFRVIDTGVRSARRQVAFDQALIEARKSDAIPDTIRFLRFPPSALIGRHQALAREVHVDYCRKHDIGLARRITGGGAIYFDPGQLGWELVFRRTSIAVGTMGELTRAICEAAAAGLSRLGVEARFRPRNDIEIDGRKVSGSGGFFDGDTLFFQGTVLIDLDPADMVAALNVPQAKLARRSLESVAQRVVTLKELLGAAPSIALVQQVLLDGFAERLGIDPVREDITEAEEAWAQRLHDEEIGTDAFVEEIDEPGSDASVRSGVHSGPGGSVTAFVRLAGPDSSRIREALFTGDFFVTPPRAVYDLEASLRDVSVSDAGETVERFFARANIGLLSVSAADFRAALEASFV